MKWALVLSFLLPAFSLADLPTRDTYVYRLRETFRTGRAPQEKDLLVSQEWRCSEAFAYRTRRSPETFKFFFTPSKMAASFSSTLGKDFTFEKDGNLVSRVTARHYEIRWYVRVANDGSNNLVFEGMVLPRVGGSFGVPSISDPKGTANTYAVCRSQLSQ